MPGAWSSSHEDDRDRHPAAAPEVEAMTPGAGCGQLEADRAVLTLKAREDMRHPPTAWTDPSYADEPLERLLGDYLAYLRGRARPVAPGTVDKYRKTLVSFVRSLRSHGDEPTLAALTPGAVNRWVTDQRRRGRSEDGIANRLVALKVFSNKYLYRELELTTGDLLRKVPRITPTDRPRCSSTRSASRCWPASTSRRSRTSATGPSSPSTWRPGSASRRCSS